MEKRVTLRDLAQATGVHFTTVGLALRHDPRVRPETIAKVEAAARQLGYTQDAMLSALSAYRHRHSHRLAGVIAYLVTYEPGVMLKTNITERRLVEAATAHARSRNFNLESFQINAPDMTAARMTKLLHARGIQGVIVPPRLPAPGPMEALDWSGFSTIAVGYSITSPNLHRVCAGQAHNTRLAIAQLRARGYKRVGLVLPSELYERSRGHVLGAYLSEQCLQPPAQRVAPLFVPHAELNAARLRQWLRAERVDAVALTGLPGEIYNWAQELGYKIPDDLGFALVSRYGKTDHIAGVDERMEAIGQAAVDAVIGLISNNERGLPEYPRHLLVEGTWVERPSVRPAPVAVAAQA